MNLSKEKKKEYREKNNEKIKEQGKLYYQENKERIKEKVKEYSKKNANEIKEKTKLYRENNREKLRESDKKWREENKEKKKEKNRIYRKTHKKEINEYFKNKRENDDLYKLKISIRNLIGNSLRKKNYTKKSKSHQIMDCSFEELKTYIESLWEPWMNWSNYGSVNGKQPTGINQCWDIDHIIRLSTSLTEEELLKLFHYTNLQPLCSYTNRWIKKS